MALTMDNMVLPMESWIFSSPGWNVIIAPGGHDTISHIRGLLILQG